MFDITFFAYPTELVWWQLALYSSSIAWGSFVIGCIGVGGGAIWMPLLLLLPGMTPAVAAGSIFAGNVPTSACRICQLLYYRRLAVRKALPLMLGALLGALLGQLALPHLPTEVVAFLVAGLAIWAGVQTHRRFARERRARKGEASPAPAVPQELPAAGADAAQEGGDAEVADVSLAVEEAPPAPPATADGAPAATEEKATKRGTIFSLDRDAATTREWWLQTTFKAVLGLVASFLSSISGTGGPLIIFPLGMLLDPEISMKALVALSVPFSSVLVSFSMLGALLFGRVDLGIALLFAVVGTFFNLLGGVLQERLGDSKLKMTVGAVLVLVGLSVAVRTAVGMAS